MSSFRPNSSDKSKALAAKYKWTGIVIVVLAILGYSIFTDSPIKKIIIGEVKVEFAVKPGPTIYYTTSEASVDSGGSDYLIPVPDEDPIYLSLINYIIIEPGEDDPQNFHSELVGTALGRGQLDVKYEESDQSGRFAIWLTSSKIEEGREIFIYTTRYIRNDGTIEIAWREAYLDGDTWFSQISPDLIEMVGHEGITNDSVGIGQPQIKSVNEVLQSLNNEKYRLIRGQISALALLNNCFVNGQIMEDDLTRYISTEIALAREIGLTFEASRVIAEFGYSLYLEKEYLGSKIFWEAMILLNPWDSYSYNVLGVCLEGINRYESALQAYEKALLLDPEYEDAIKNFQQLSSYLEGTY